jgi:hypothetical protein
MCCSLGKGAPVNSEHGEVSEVRSRSEEEREREREM